MLEKKEIFPIVNILGKDVHLKGYYCTEKYRKLCKKDCKSRLGVGLYIEVNKICNAHCKFCNIPKNQNHFKFDFEKFEKIYSELVKQKILTKVAITGGEPFLTFDTINNILDIIYRYSDYMSVSITTNGVNVYNILKLNHLNIIESINISRHHYNDELNNEIFGFKTATEANLIEISKLLPSDILGLKCNLVRGYIDSIEKIKNYLDFASKIGVKTVRFEVLREENEFCKKNKIETCNLQSNGSFLHIRSFYDREYCQCNYYIYESNNSKFINVSDRNIKKNNNDYCFQLLYTNNELFEGFGKRKII